MSEGLDHFEILRNIENNPDLCPHCGSVLILKQKAKAKFFACPKYPICRYTMPVDQYRTKKGKRYCEKCGGNQRLPLKNKVGEIVPYTWIFCECREEEEFHSYLPSLSPEHFDFPMSHDSYRSLCQEHGWSDPGPDRPQEPEEAKPQVVEHIHRHSEMSRKDFDELQQLRFKVDYLEKRLNERKVGKQGIKYTVE